MNARIKKLEDLKGLNISAYPYTYKRDSLTKTISQEFDSVLKAGDERTDAIYRIAGRIISYRSFGKLSFLKLQDFSGTLQVAIKKGISDDESFRLQKMLDPGDIIGVEGYIFKTHKGETTLMTKHLVLLSKSLRPLPEKWHGLTDIEERYRKRYVDLIVNRISLDLFIKREKIIDIIRNFFKDNKFTEVELPLLQPMYGGAFAKPFKAHSNAWNRDMFLSISPELYLKRLLVGGFDKVFTITKAFRNEDVDRTHNPEFTIMESYASYWDYNDVMNAVETLYEKIALELYGSTKINYGETEIDFKRPWKRITIKDSLKEYANIDVEKLSDDEIKKILRDNKADMPEYNRGIAITELFDALVEDKLINPTFVIDYPRESTPLCKKHRNNPKLVERFELFINGWELANAYSELNNPIEQKKLFEIQIEQRKAKGEYQPMDKDFVEAMEYGMPPAGGLGIGIDRMVMLFTNAQSIRDVILFPQMKPKDIHKNDSDKE